MFLLCMVSDRGKLFAESRKLFQHRMYLELYWNSTKILDIRKLASLGYQGRCLRDSR